MNKIDRAIEFYKKLEQTSKRLSKPIVLRFSGGKDSQCIYHLAKMAGIEFTAEMNLTSVDPPQVIHFVRENYPDVKIVRPYKTMWQLIAEKKMLPTRITRYCCAELKERYGGGEICVIGVRRAESVKRSKRNEIEFGNRKFSGSLDQFNRGIEGEQIQDQCMSAFNEKEKIMAMPIIDWTDADVWNFLNSNGIKHCELYNEGYHRIGCILCPMQSLRIKRKDEVKFQKYKLAYMRAIEKVYNHSGNFTSAEDMYEWWVSGMSINEWKANRKQLKLDI